MCSLPSFLVLGKLVRMNFYFGMMSKNHGIDDIILWSLALSLVNRRSCGLRRRSLIPKRNSQMLKTPGRDLKRNWNPCQTFHIG